MAREKEIEFLAPGGGLDGIFLWHSEPSTWHFTSAGAVLTIQPDGSTDFWRRTHYGFDADNGHFLHTPVAGAFRMSARIRFGPLHQYDQAGLMVRISEDCWLKTSIEFEPGLANRLGAVVTNSGYSDWSTQDVAKGVTEFRLSIIRRGADYTLDASVDGRKWRQIRLARLIEDTGTTAVMCGVYACCPKEAGFSASFDEFRIQMLD